MTTIPTSLTAHLNDPHKHPAFRDGRAMCPRGFFIEEHPLDGQTRICPQPHICSAPRCWVCDPKEGKE